MALVLGIIAGDPRLHPQYRRDRHRRADGRGRLQRGRATRAGGRSAPISSSRPSTAMSSSRWSRERTVDMPPALTLVVADPGEHAVRRARPGAGRSDGGDDQGRAGTQFGAADRAKRRARHDPCFTIIGGPRPAYRVRIALNLKRVAYERRDGRLLEGEQRAPENLARNPQGSCRRSKSTAGDHAEPGDHRLARRDAVPSRRWCRAIRSPARRRWRRRW